ncbi:MAG: AbrB family transcriptional regulator [Pseudomonadota bacterium]
MNNMAQMGVFITGGVAGGLLMHQTKLPAGALLGALLGGIACKFLVKQGVALPDNWQLVLQIFIGLTIASKFEVEMLAILKPLLLPILLSAMALIATGLASTVLLVKLGLLDSGTAYLATSPGAMSVLVGVASSMDVNAPVTVVFHLARIMMIVVSAPFVVKLLRYLLH